MVLSGAETGGFGGHEEVFVSTHGGTANDT